VALYSLLLLAFDAIDSSKSDSPFMIGFVWTAIGCAAAYLSIRFISKDLISGATIATIPLLALSVLFLFGNTIDDGNIGFPMIVLGVAYGAAWALPILRARPALLSSGLLSAGFGIVILIMQSSISGYSVFDSPTDLLTSVAQQSSSLLLIAGDLTERIGHHWDAFSSELESFLKEPVPLGYSKRVAIEPRHRFFLPLQESFSLPSLYNAHERHHS
jgi:hypothetical protein